MNIKTDAMGRFLDAEVALTTDEGIQGVENEIWLQNLDEDYNKIFTHKVKNLLIQKYCKIYVGIYFFQIKRFYIINILQCHSTFF